MSFTDAALHRENSVLMKKLLDAGTNSDLTVHVGDRTWKVHRVIVSIKSEFFEKACYGPFAKETYSGVIHLKEERDWVVDDLLEFLYTGNYLTTRNEINKGLRHLYLYAAGKKFLVDGLCGLAANRFENATPDVRSMKFKDLWLMIDLVYLHGPENVTLTNCLITYTHARIKVIAKHKEFSGCLVKNPEFAIGLIKKGWEKKS